MSKIAVLFAGQGAQYKGMGALLHAHYPHLDPLYQKASDILGYHLSDVCFHDEKNQLSQTLYAQPAIYVTSMALFDILKTYHLPIAMTAGLSLGEYSALTSASVFSFEEGLRLIQQRAQAMEEASTDIDGTMAAIIGLSEEQVHELCAEEEAIYVANLNAPNQIIVSGTTIAVKRFCELAKNAGAKRAIPLSVSGAFHSPFMALAAKKMRPLFEVTQGNKPDFPVYMNVNATPLCIEELPKLLTAQIERAVLFEETIRRMVKDGATTFIEIGPGKVLSGFVKRICPEAHIITLNEPNDFRLLEGLL